MIDSTNYLNAGIVQHDLCLNQSNYEFFEERFEPCRVCGEQSSGWHCGAVTCEACKKFFLRSVNGEDTKYKCVRNKDCVIDRATRTQCQYCRFKKCKDVGMTIDENPNNPTIAELFKAFPCQVCSAPSSGQHFGVITCEGCKGFFRRSIKERAPEKYKCMDNGNCEISLATRNMCRYCRFQRCLRVGMSVQNSRIGRQSNLFKHRIIEHQRRGVVPNSEYLNNVQRKTKLNKTSKECLYFSETFYQQNNNSVFNASLNNPASNNYLLDSKINTKFENSIPCNDYYDHNNNNNFALSNTNNMQTDQVYSQPQQLQFSQIQPTLPSVQFNQVSIEVLFDKPTIDMVQFLHSSYVRFKYEVLETSNEQQRKFIAQNLNNTNFLNYDSDGQVVLSILSNYALKFTNFVDSIPEFLTIINEDKTALIKDSIHSVILLILQQECKYQNYFNADDILYQKLVKVLPIFSKSKDILKGWHEAFANFKLDDIEYSLFISLIVVSTGTKNLIEFEKVCILREKLNECLYQYMLARRNNDEVFKDLITNLPEMRRANTFLMNGIEENIKFLSRNDTTRSFSFLPSIYLPINV